MAESFTIISNLAVTTCLPVKNVSGSFSLGNLYNGTTNSVYMGIGK